jgi:hypothetical protein
MNRMREHLAKDETRGIALIACDRIIKDADTSQLSLIGTFDMLLVPSAPYKLANLQVYAKVSGTKDGPVNLGLYSPDGSLLHAATAVPNVPTEFGALSVPFILTDVVFPVYGEYAFQIEFDRKILLESAFWIVQAQQKPQT